ncbi:MAG: hypothetical protein DHS20C14_17570 [Phycisphaeraceae bacterium]|nr:MAG: hypothetical protein DHS20C14_17570 [Phycisphaeraceae bacterium]
MSSMRICLVIATTLFMSGLTRGDLAAIVPDQEDYLSPPTSYMGSFASASTPDIELMRESRSRFPATQQIAGPAAEQEASPHQTVNYDLAKAMADLDQSVLDDDRFKEAYTAYLIAVANRNVDIMEERRRSVHHQHSATVWSTAIVHIMVIAATFIACVQIAAGLRWAKQSKSNKKRHKKKQEAAAETRLSLSLGSLAMTTSVQGVVLMGLSYAFYTAYLLLVYPIRFH